MSLAVVHTRALIGIQAPQVHVEVHISNGLPGFTLVGLPETSVKEAKDRVRSAIINSGFSFPAQRITVNLAPADLPKDGSRFDLPIAIAILVASGQLPADKLNTHEFIGELALSGHLRAIKGAITAALATAEQKRTLILAAENAVEVSLLQNANNKIAGTLFAVCQYIENVAPLDTVHYIEPIEELDDLPELQEIIGQEQAKRALEIAAAGGHNLLLMGPPGTGKTMLATRLKALLPPLTNKEAIVSAAIASLVNIHHRSEEWQQRPYRAPHHSASLSALVGGGTIPKPGEISLSHNGILFLDELPEFDRKVLDALRQPLESGEITISRANSKVTFPAQFQLIAAMNPSPTGHYQGLHNRTNPQQIMRYLSKLSGPFLDRFDLSIEVPMLPKGALSQKKRQGETTLAVRERVIRVRHCQYTRSGKLNAHLSNRDIDSVCYLAPDDALFLEQALLKLGLSARAWHRILKVSRTIADLAQSETIQKVHLIEALNYRCMDNLLLQLHKDMRFA